MKPAALAVEVRIISEVKPIDDRICNRSRLQYLDLRLEVVRRFGEHGLLLNEWSSRISEQHLHLRCIGWRCDPQKHGARRKRECCADYNHHILPSQESQRPINKFGDPISPTLLL